MSDLPATGDIPAPGVSVPAEFPALPDYEIMGELGRGGMGVVYKARQVSLNRLVALKLIRDGALAGLQDRARFRIETEAAARMRHPNVVQIYDVGEHAGLPYFAMEFVEGTTLDKHLAGRPQPAVQAALLVRTLALAIEHAHVQKIVHRDLKPSNVLMEVAHDQKDRAENGAPETDDRSLSSPLSALRPCVTDFGLAKRLDSDSTAWTQDGAVLGTASYMAPEQAAGRVNELGPAVDVYALGAILYELLTGRPPFRSDTRNQTIAQVMFDEPTPPTRLHADVPHHLESVCLKCLEKEPGRRYAKAADLADDLHRFLEGQPVAAVPVSARERLVRLAACDGYQIIDEVRRGPRSTVYRALSGLLKQPVALKVFAANAGTREQWEDRIGRGANLWAALAHPHIVHVQRAGWWDAAPYVTCEYIAHGSLADRLASQRFSVRDAVRLVMQLAEIVGYVHRQGAVHGNLKPSNVLLAADGIPRVIDFRLTGGLFVAPPPTAERDPGGPNDISREVDCEGNDLREQIGYVAPELLDDPNAELRVNADVYGLGTILYALLAGRPPFVGATACETREQVRSQTPAPPSKFKSEVAPHLDAICLRCLHKNPWRRFSRAYDLLTRLRWFQDDPMGRAQSGRRSN